MYGSSRYPGSSSSGGGSYRHEGPYDQLRAFIERACNPMLPEPNMSLNLEIADLVNAKKANMPREAAVEVLRNVNSRNTHQSMLALNLLDTLVKNCGYPMHLQIATKDFLNELVRRFPERPPAFPPPPMNKILELVHEWKNTICVSSKHKEDLTNIRDMHRLLGYKGYRFRDFDKRAAQVLNPSDSLKSPDELEEEDRAAQAAKLQELIRRGTPKDLAAAQELMKVMAGAEPGKKPDYASQTAKELASIQHRVLMLNEMLDNMKPNERFADGDAFDQIAVRCRNVQPKIQKWIGSAEENEDADTIDKLLLMNDLINNVIARYESFKKGDRSASAEINPAFYGKSGDQGGAGGKSRSTASKAAPAPNLIDFDEPASDSTTNGASQGSDAFGLEGLNLGGLSASASTGPLNNGHGGSNDLLAGLSFGGPAQQQQQQHPFYQQYQSYVPAQQQQQAISWGNLTPSGAAQQRQQPAHVAGNGNGNLLGGLSFPSSSSPSAAAAPPPQSAHMQQQQANRPLTPAGAINLGMVGSLPSTPTQQQQQRTASPFSTNVPPQQPNAGRKDPFEDLLM